MIDEEVNIESNDENLYNPTFDENDVEINLLIRERRIYSSNSHETSFRSLPMNSSKHIETIWEYVYQSFNEGTNFLCRLFERILDIISVPRKWVFVFIFCLAFFSLKSQKAYERASNPYKGVIYYKSETFSSNGITSSLAESVKQDNSQGISKSLYMEESLIPIPISMKNVADISKLPVTKQDIPFYFHIPRAGGSTIANILGSCFGLVGTSHVGLPWKDANLNATKLEVFTANDGSRVVNVETTTLEGVENAKRLKLVESGLVNFIVTQHLHGASELFTDSNKGRMFTILRDPVERAISLFYYLAIANWEPTYDPSLATMSIEMWARSEDKIEHNWMTRFLSNNLTGNLSQHDLDLAKEILRKKCLVGLLEAKDESMRRFIKYFHWDMNDFQTRECTERFLDWGWSNKNSHPPIDVESQTYSLLVKSNKYDIELYNYAKILFEAQAKLL